MSDITIKIHGGVGRLTGTSLCRSCSHSHIRVDRQGEQISCEATGSFGALHVVRSDVRDCNHYYNKALPSLYDMEQTAWTLRTEKGGKQIGFTPPKKDDDTPVRPR